MRKTIMFFFVSALMFLALSAMVHASDTPDDMNVRRGAISTVSVCGGSKRAALEAANSKVENGETPYHISYFSDGTKYRTVEDGYYTITLGDSDMCFNVDSDGINSDYEGIRITVWQNTTDITQRFRLVMNDDGAYYIYAACSRGGFNRVVGYNAANDTVGLYSKDSPYAAAFYIRNSKKDDNSKYIVLASDETKYLGCTEDAYSGQSVTLGALGEEGVICSWRFETWGSAGVAGAEKAMYPADMLLVTQAPFDIYTHQNQNAADIQTYTDDSMFAPFTCKVTAINEQSGNVVWIQSLSKVLYADGSYDYMTCLFMHDNDISDIYVGEILLQGQDFYEMGTAGYAEGSHVHVSCFRGEYSPSMKISNLGEDAVNIWDAFFLPADIPVSEDYGFAWMYDK